MFVVEVANFCNTTSMLKYYNDVQLQRLCGVWSVALHNLTIFNSVSIDTEAQSHMEIRFMAKDSYALGQKSSEFGINYLNFTI